MFFRRKKAPPPFDTTGKVPVIRTSICTGEQTAGFRDEATGKFFEIMLLRTDSDLKQFLADYGVAEADLRREY